VGVFGIGLAAYWPQFPGLKERLEGYQRKVEARLGEWASVVSAGLVDDATQAHKAGAAFRQAGVDLVFCYVGTYATSSQVLPVIQEAKAPVVVLNLQPVAALDYAHTDTGEWLANCSACCVPEIAGAFVRAAIPFRQVTGMLEAEPDVREPSGVRPPRWFAICARLAWDFSGTPTPECWICIVISPSTRRNWGRTSRFWKCATWRRA
jgi:L-arabinose isomerase